MPQSFTTCLLQRTEKRQHTATHCNTLQHTAAHCSTLQRTATRNLWRFQCQVFAFDFISLIFPFWSLVCRHEHGNGNTSRHCDGYTLQHTATHCNTLQHTATHCNILQHTAAYCSMLQNTATRPRIGAPRLQHTVTHAIHCNTNTVTRRGNTMQHTATHATPCNTLQHTHGHATARASTRATEKRER